MQNWPPTGSLEIVDIVISINIIIIIARPKTAYGRQGLAGVSLRASEGMLVQAGEKLDGQLPAIGAKPLQLHRDGGGASQVLVARMVVGKDGEDSSKEIPLFDEMVKVADSPASSNSSNS